MRRELKFKNGATFVTTGGIGIRFNGEKPETVKILTEKPKKTKLKSK